MTPYEELIQRAKDVHVLHSVASILHWDQETMMPPGGLEHRARQLKTLATIAHEDFVDPRIGDLLQACEEDPELCKDAKSPEAVNIRELRRSFDRKSKIPKELVAELAETKSLAQHHWALARKASDFDKFKPWLAKMLELKRQEAECLGVPEGGELWDALADSYEAGMCARDLEALFAPLRASLSNLIAELRDGGTEPSDRFNRLALPTLEQEAFVRFVSEKMGFDYERGRLDRSTHPFCGGSHCHDVRLTTRFHEDNVLDALGSTMHETGHGIYEQGLAENAIGTPMGTAVSLGIHESQSRLWENMVGRSLPFLSWLQPQLKDFFGAKTKDFSAAEIYGTANLVRPGLIRVEADELSYNLHVMIRFEIELLFMRGELPISDLPGLWNEKYREYLGIEVPNDRLGCLQDVHWSAGLLGYFPTYTLGNIYAAQFFNTAKAEISGLEEQFADGEFDTLKTWLNEKIHAHGQRYLAPELVSQVSGQAADASFLLDYLQAKLRPVYGMS